MTSTFKATITPSLLKLVQKHPIGKRISELTDFDLEKVLLCCSLEVPEEVLPGSSWIVTRNCDVLNVKPEHVHIVQVLLKLVWLYSDQIDRH